MVSRPGYEFSVSEADAEVAASIVDIRGKSKEVNLLVEPDQKRVFVTDVVSLDISATAVRKAALVSPSGALEELVPREVAEYIRKYRLYRNKNE